MDNGYRVMFVSLRGFDESRLPATLKGIANDTTQTINYVSHKFPNEPILLIGQSFSSVPMLCNSNATPNIKGVIVEGVFKPREIGYQIAERSIFSLLLFPIVATINLSIPDEFSIDKCFSKRGFPDSFLFITR